MTVYNDLEAGQPRVEVVLSQGEELVTKLGGETVTGLENSLRTLRNTLASVQARAEERKGKLELALKEAQDFNDSLEAFQVWLGNTEKALLAAKPVSRVLETCDTQVEEHELLQMDIGHQREVMLALDKTGTHLKYFATKQDTACIKGQLSGVQARWEKVVVKADERARHLEAAHKVAKECDQEAAEFQDMWSDLCDWLAEAEEALKGDAGISNEPDKIRHQLIKHREFQKLLNNKMVAYDMTMKKGKVLKEKAPSTDIAAIQSMLNTLKNSWNGVSSLAVERQRKLEEAQAFSGQVKEAMKSLLEWLYKVEPTQAEHLPVRGDIETVKSLADQHKAFRHELVIRSQSVDTVQKSAQELLEKSSDEEGSVHLQGELQELTAMWDSVCKLSLARQERIDVALRLGEDFRVSVDAFLEWLSDAELELCHAGPLSEDEDIIKEQLDDHQRLVAQLAEHEGALNHCKSLGDEIMAQCHPEAERSMKHWLSVIQQRWDEANAWASQREDRLYKHLQGLKDSAHMLEELLAWLIRAEDDLRSQDAKPIPDNLEAVQKLMQEHQSFQGDMMSKQPEVEQITKSGKRAAPATSTPAAGKKGKQSPDKQDPKVAELFNKWRGVWLLAMERQRKLNDAYNSLMEIERLKNFKFDDWRKRYLDWMDYDKGRMAEFFRRLDKDRDGKVTRDEFINGILKSKFPTSQLEMGAVADIFDKDADGFIDYKEFLAALKPDLDRPKPKSEAQKIDDEVQRQVCQCTCPHLFIVHQIGEGMYRFGDSQKLRLVRILRSTVMVRVGGGWMPLDEFLVKNDPCRAKGRTNLELREQFILAEGVAQSMVAFKTKSPAGSSHGSTHSGYSAGSFSSCSSTPGSSSKHKTSTPLSRKVHSQHVAQRKAAASPDGSDTSSLNSASFATCAAGHLAAQHSPEGVKPGSRTSSQAASRSSSRASSRTPSRAGSEQSLSELSSHSEPLLDQVETTLSPVRTSTHGGITMREQVCMESCTGGRNTHFSGNSRTVHGGLGRIVAAVEKPLRQCLLVKNDPCVAKGRTNLDRREQFTLAEGVAQSFSSTPGSSSKVVARSGRTRSRRAPSRSEPRPPPAPPANPPASPTKSASPSSSMTTTRTSSPAPSARSGVKATVRSAAHSTPGRASKIPAPKGSASKIPAPKP
ncbi:PREDICTED: microtubule-actin cross-linking factor 1-like [Priapulus caudatus]|uniref:Microtubule-actin cross-linking factor 1-like n=1 Tax=Priapulus caudatus TaxID=37621 RepID=A0ABM1E7B8_PRICU|nr:PREDICTED: microtubule-actin cross-linking factor 1-like [Priapulus caudatus]